MKNFIFFSAIISTFSKVVKKNRRMSTSICRSGNMIMPSIGLGTMDLSNKAEEINTIIENSLNIGYKRIDCAPVYFNEHLIGDALYEYLNKKIDRNFSRPTIKREDLFLTSKLPCTFHKKELVEPALKKTLADLRVDYLDLYLIHWPVSFKVLPNSLEVLNVNRRGYENEDIDDSDNGNNIDPYISIHETWQAMENLVNKGLVRHIGVSNFPVTLLHELLSRARIKPFLNQIEIHPYLQQEKLLKYCFTNNIQIQAYSPLGTPGYKSKNEPYLLNDPLLKQIALNHSITVAQLCLLWALQRNTSIVVKSSHPQRQKENLVSNQKLTLSREEMEKIANLDKGYRFFRPEEWWGDKNLAVFH